MCFSEGIGFDCESYCVFGWKCNLIDDVICKECECFGYGNEKFICKFYLSKFNDDFIIIIMVSLLILL